MEPLLSTSKILCEAHWNQQSTVWGINLFIIIKVLTGHMPEVKE